MGLIKIDNIMFRVQNLEKSRKFYEEILGMRKVWEDKKNKMMGFIFSKSDSEIVIHSNKKLGKFDYSFLVEDVGEFVRRFAKKGYKIIQKPIEVRCGKYAVLSDLDNNKIPIIDLTKFNNKARYNE